MRRKKQAFLSKKGAFLQQGLLIRLIKKYDKNIRYEYIRLMLYLII